MQTMIRISLLALFAPIAMASAQEGAARDPWAPFLGCWTPAGSNEAASARCILPGDAAQSVDIIDVRDGESVSESTLLADGQRHDMAADGCTGWEMARFSDDGARLYVNAEMTCDDGPLQKTSGIFSISPTGAWIDVHGVTVAAQKSLQVRRSDALLDLSAMPSDVRARLEPRARSSGIARLAASLDLSVERVIDASLAVDGNTVEGWVVENSRDASLPEPVSAKDLERMVAAGVDDRVMDAMVAISYPESFQVAVAPGGGVGEITSAEPLVGGMDLRNRPNAPYGFDPLLMSQECAYLGYGWGSARDRFYCSSFGYGSLYSPYSYGRYGYGYGGYGYPYGYGYPVTVIVRPSDGGGEAEPRGEVVKGRGYRRTGTSGSGDVARPRSSPTPPAVKSGSSSGSRASSRSGNSSSTEKKRTAKPRKP